MTASLPPMRALQVFEAVARCGSMSAASDELGVSSGAISQQIHNLEVAMGTRLFERRGRSLELSHWGRMYYNRIGFAFDQLRKAQEAVLLARSKAGLVVSALPSLAIRWFRPLLQSWRDANPGAGVRLIGTDEEVDFAEEQIDFRLSYGSAVRRYSHYVELFVDRVVPVCSPAFLERHPVQAPGDILDCPLIDIQWDIRHQPPPSWSDWAHSVGLDAPKTPSDLAFSLSSVAIDAAVNGDGFVLGQIAMIAEDLATGRLVAPIDRRLRMPESYFLAWQRSALDRPSGAEFRTFIVAAARRHAAILRQDDERP